MNINVENISFYYDKDPYPQIFGSIKLKATENIDFGEKLNYSNREFSTDISVSIYNLPQELQQKFIDLYKEVDDYIKDAIKRGE